MLTKFVGNKGGSVSNSIVKKVVDKAKGMYKQEEIAYQGAFLAQARTALLPYLQQATHENSLDCLPSEELEHELLSKAYEDVNDLYTDEHMIMTQADLLE